MNSVKNEVMQIGDLKFEVVGVKSLKLNEDNATAEVVLDVRDGDRLAELTIYKLNLTTMRLGDTTSENGGIETREISATMSIDTIQEPYTIKFI